MVNPCAMMVYMGAIANNGTAVMPSLIKPTSFIDQQLSKLPKFGTQTKKHDRNLYCNVSENHDGK